MLTHSSYSLAFVHTATALVYVIFDALSFYDNAVNTIHYVLVQLKKHSTQPTSSTHTSNTEAVVSLLSG